MKKRIFICIASVLVAVIILVSGVGVYKHYHSISYKFNDIFVIGNSIENIIEKYGEFDIDFYSETTGEGEVYYLIEKKSHSWDDTYYVISFEDGVAYDITESLRPGG